ncbi:uncharacterized protein LOC118644220 [Monomorium pharaonis]|uniref:uncharacterized protein LOC105829349 n=1 Tax=Monomorium pharaonis TaxID=307658 RepID=UPI00063F31CA|nr:uncharacterized protein LOC105829349 [Monomorium pharaonis]XP_036150627.1 uncharacterized protein LOC118644220 [Monomorium pharaonis]
MKSYVCAILLLMCELTQFVTRVQGNCMWENKSFSQGTHTIHPCRQLICNENGVVTVIPCLPQICGESHEFIAYTGVDENQEYPACCAQPICKSRDPNSEYPRRIGYYPFNVNV